MRLTIEDALQILDYAGEGRTNSVKPDLLANELNRRIERIVESDLRLERAAALREAADAIDEVFKRNMSGENWHSRARNFILSLIPSTDQSALDKLLAEARLEEAEWWHGMAEVHPDPNLSESKRLAQLRAAAPKESKPSLSIDDLYRLEENHPPMVGHTGRPKVVEDCKDPLCPCHRK